MLKLLWVIFFKPKIRFDYNDKTQQCKVFIDDKHWFDKMRDYFSTKNEAKKFVKGPMKHWVKDRIYFITSTGWYNFGLTHDIVLWIKENIKDREVFFSESFKNKFKTDDDNKCIEELKLELRPYQRECVELALKYRTGTFVLGTGAGKTLTIASIIDNLLKQKGLKRVLILVPDNNLVLQFNDELVNQYGLKGKICLFFDKFNKIDEEANIIIANRPLFLMRFLQYRDFFVNKLDCLIVDEAHSIKRQNKITKCISKIKCDYKFGFTGTLAEERENYYKTIGLLGAIRYEKTSKELRDEGYLSSVKIRLLNLEYSERFHKMFYREELEFIQNNERRNKFIGKTSLSLKNRLCPTTVLKKTKMNKSLNKNVRVGLSLVDNNFAHESINKKHPILLVYQGVEGNSFTHCLSNSDTLSLTA